MTLIAQFDLEEEPCVVTWLYDYGSDQVPPHMVMPEYMDVTDVEPRPQPGSTYDESADVWTYPPLPVDIQAWAIAAVAANQAFLRNPAPVDVQYQAQVNALTTQVNTILRYQYPDVAPPLPGAAGGPASPPIAAFTCTPSAPAFRDTVSFDATISIEGSAPIVSYDWTFGDTNTTATGATPTHQFTRHGTFDVTLVVTDEGNLTGQYVKTIVIA